VDSAFHFHAESVKAQIVSHMTSTCVKPSAWNIVFSRLNIDGFYISSYTVVRLARIYTVDFARVARIKKWRGKETCEIFLSTFPSIQPKWSHLYLIQPRKTINQVTLPPKKSLQNVSIETIHLYYFIQGDSITQNSWKWVISTYFEQYIYSLNHWEYSLGVIL